LYFKQLELKNFRNYSSLTTDFSSQMNIFLGSNGQGKTNLLEALYLLSQGDSFRYGENDVFLKKGHNEAIVRTQLTSKELDFDITLQVLKSRKNYFLNSKKVSSNSISDKFHCILFSPESLSAIKEGDDQRRQLLDDLLGSAGPQEAQLVQDFKKTLRTRNKVLKDYVNGNYTEKQAKELLESLDPIFLKLSTELCTARIEILNKILPDVNNAMRFIEGKTIVDISVEYVISGKNALHLKKDEIHDIMYKRSQELRSAELSLGTSLVGPQKHDITFLYNQNNSRFFCSQGQQRGLILSYKMAQIVYHRRIHGNDPVLMLDDVLSELDQERRSALISFLKEIKAQIFITTTDLHLHEEMRTHETAVFKIAEGQILERSLL
jgi:DNA replication and repair protein RecF